MPLVLVRVDDRLIHGQVTIGWGPTLRPEVVVLVDDAVAASEWEMDLYRAAAPDGATVQALTTAGAAAEWSRLAADPRRVLVLLRSPSTLVALRAAGVALPAVNVGGMHFAAGKREVLPYVFVNDADVADLRALSAAGIAIEARDLPGNPGHNLAALVGVP